MYIAAECLAQTGDDQDADGFRDCLYGITFTGAIGDNYSFDDNGEVVGLSNAVVQVLPLPSAPTTTSATCPWARPPLRRPSPALLREGWGAGPASDGDRPTGFSVICPRLPACQPSDN